MEEPNVTTSTDGLSSSLLCASSSQTDCSSSSSPSPACPVFLGFLQLTSSHNTTAPYAPAVASDFQDTEEEAVTTTLRFPRKDEQTSSGEKRDRKSLAATTHDGVPTGEKSAGGDQKCVPLSSLPAQASTVEYLRYFRVLESHRQAAANSRLAPSQKWGEEAIAYFKQVRLYIHKLQQESSEEECQRAEIQLSTTEIFVKKQAGVDAILEDEDEDESMSRGRDGEGDGVEEEEEEDEEMEGEAAVVRAFPASSSPRSRTSHKWRIEAEEEQEKNQSNSRESRQQTVVQEGDNNLTDNQTSKMEERASLERTSRPSSSFWPPQLAHLHSGASTQGSSSSGFDVFGNTPFLVAERTSSIATSSSSSSLPVGHAQACAHDFPLSTTTKKGLSETAMSVSSCCEAKEETGTTLFSEQTTTSLLPPQTACLISDGCSLSSAVALSTMAACSLQNQTGSYSFCSSASTWKGQCLPQSSPTLASKPSGGLNRGEASWRQHYRNNHPSVEAFGKGFDISAAVVLNLLLEDVLLLPLHLQTPSCPQFFSARQCSWFFACLACLDDLQAVHADVSWDLQRLRRTCEKCRQQMEDESRRESKREEGAEDANMAAPIYSTRKRQNGQDREQKVDATSIADATGKQLLGNGTKDDKFFFSAEDGHRQVDDELLENKLASVNLLITIIRDYFKQI